MRFCVQLNAFSGPLDLLYYLIRRNELDVRDIPIAEIADQYLELLSVLEQFDFDSVGEFLELASRLIEIKSQMVLPRHEEEEEEEIEDPRSDLVQRLLQYKKFKDAAAVLEERRQQWQLQYPRRVRDIDDGPVDPGDQPIQEVELWDLVSAFSRVMRQNAATQPTSIRYDDTPIEVHAQMISARLENESEVSFAGLFESGANRSQLVGVFLALLELIRKSRVVVQQAENFGQLWISRGPSYADDDKAELSPHELSAETEMGELESRD